MPETPKKESVCEKESSQQPEEKNDTLDEDQKCHKYYYDDAYGYETYEDDDADND